MGDHVHKKGGFMTSYRYMYMNMEGNRAGTDSLSTQDVLGRGFDRAPTEMQMEMHMFGLMMAPSDAVTLMAMFNYVEKDMEMMGHMGAMPAMSTMPGMSHMGHSGNVHKHSTSGWGDVTLTALFSIWAGHRHTLHAGLGLGLPTAEVEETLPNGMFQPFGMQLGNGVWDARPSLTYVGHTDASSWGSQASGRINLESENASGFAYGDQFSLTAWGARQMSEMASVSARVVYDYQARISGAYDGPSPMMAPVNFQDNYGGDVVQLGAGVNLLGREGLVQDHRVLVEGLFPVYEDLNGIQMSRDYTVTVAWKKGW